MKIATVSVKGHGSVVVTRATDEAGNERMVPVSGAATLEQWIANRKLLAPWLLDSDLEDGYDFGEIMEILGA